MKNVWWKTPSYIYKVKLSLFCVTSQRCKWGRNNISVFFIIILNKQKGRATKQTKGRTFEVRQRRSKSWWVEPCCSSSSNLRVQTTTVLQSVGCKLVLKSKLWAVLKSYFTINMVGFYNLDRFKLFEDFNPNDLRFSSRNLVSLIQFQGRH